MATLILHIGYPKTGTSMLQAMLGHNRLQLKNAGIDLLESRIVSVKPERKADIAYQKEHAWIAHKLLFEPVSHSTEIWKRVTEWVSSSDSRYCMISSEVFCLLSYDRVMALYEMIGKLDVRILIWLRSQPDAINSGYLEAIKEGHKVQQFPDYLKHQIKSGFYHYSNILKRWELFGHENMIVRVYDRLAFKNGDIVNDFFESIEMDVRWIPPDSLEANNFTIGSKSYAILKAILDHPDGFQKPSHDVLVAKGRYHSLAFRQMRQALSSLDLDKKSLNLLTRKSIKSCRKAFAKDNEWVIRRYFKDEKDTLFPIFTKTGALLGRNVQLSEDDWIRLLAEMMRRLENFETG